MRKIINWVMTTSEEETGPWSFGLVVVVILISAITVAGDSLETDKEALLRLKAFLLERNPMNRGRYARWDVRIDPCRWPGISCTPDGARVTRIDLSNSQISCEMFGNFSALSELEYLNLSGNTIGGVIPQDLNQCQRLRQLNLSHNILTGTLNLSGLTNLEFLDLSLNRLSGGIEFSFPSICNKLIVANISTNNFTGRIDSCFDACRQLKYLDLSSNKFTGEIWSGIAGLVQFSASENFLTGNILGTVFRENCSLRILDLSENDFIGEFPGKIANCRDLIILNLGRNRFTGRIPAEIGSISKLEGLYLGSNNFSRDIPESLLNLKNLDFLDLSKNRFGGEVQQILGRFTQVKFLVLHSNWYTGGIYSSGILRLGNVSRLDLSYNSFSGPLPVELSRMWNLKFLILAYNQFNGSIPHEFGNMPQLQALDISFNRLSGHIPPSLGNLSSLLWLTLAHNSLSGEIPRELGNCTSLLWLNLANNNLSGRIPNELVNVGRNANETFELNRRTSERIAAGSGECLSMKRWIPAEYPPFNFAYALFTRKSCRSIWDRVLKGIGLFPVCAPGSRQRTLQISGYLQLSGNKLSGEIPKDIDRMTHLSMLHLGFNNLEGKLPPQIGQLQIVDLNLTRNKFSGEIPDEIGNLQCLKALDLSYNNFSGNFPAGLNELSELSKFNISYNPFISGVIQSTGQLATLDNSSFLGNPRLRLPSFLNNSSNQPKDEGSEGDPQKRPPTFATYPIVLVISISVLVCLVFALIIFMLARSSHYTKSLLEDMKTRHDVPSSSDHSSSWLCRTVKVIRLDETRFTYADIMRATGNFSEERVIGRGGFGTVYRGVLRNGRQVAIKKLQREGTEGEREFRAEMEFLSGQGFGQWPHPNLVTLYGWCLNGSEKILVYEYMEGGSLEHIISDKTQLSWHRRIQIAIDVARALMFLHHECYPSIVHRDVKASNVLLDKDGNARVTDFGLARVVDAGDSHVSTIIAGTVGYVAPEYGQTWQATTRGDVYSFGVLSMELATGRRAVDGGEECLVERVKRIMGSEESKESPAEALGLGGEKGAEEMVELVRVGMQCTVELPQARPNMKEVLAMLLKISGKRSEFCAGLVPPSEDWIKD